MAQQGEKFIPRHSYSLPFFLNTDASDHNCLGIKQWTRSNESNAGFCHKGKP